MIDLARIDLDIDRTVVTARLKGEIDRSNVAAVRSRLYGAVGSTATALVVDLGETTFLDSSAVALLFELHEELSVRQQQLTIVVPREAPIRRALEFSGGMEELPIEPADDP